jgi:uncharacterized protein (TIGR02271 family)
MSYETKMADRGLDTRSDTPLRTGFPFLDLMFSMQKASNQAWSSYSPRSDAQFTGNAPQPSTNTVEVIPLGEETLNVEARTVQGNTVRVRRVVVETPVEKQLTLHEEKVIVERRKPTAASTTQDTLTEKAVEMTDTFEVVDAWKSVHLLEEVVLRKNVTEHTETVRDTVRRDEVKIERPPAKALARRDAKA